MLSTDRIQSIFGSVLLNIYEDGTLQSVTQNPVRDPNTGTFPSVLGTPEACKLQRDKCTNRQREEVGYSSEDVRFLILQSGLVVTPNTDSRVSYRGFNYRVMSVDQDPARAYWDIRAREV